MDLGAAEPQGEAAPPPPIAAAAGSVKAQWLKRAATHLHPLGESQQRSRRRGAAEQRRGEGALEGGEVRREGAQ